MNRIKNIMRLADFPQEARNELDKLAVTAETDPAASAWIAQSEPMYFRGEDILPLREALADRLHCPLLTSDLLLLLTYADSLQYIYRKQGYSEDLFQGVLADLRCKMIECRQVYGIWGTFVFPWFFRFYDRTRFALGRLQYETVSCPFDYLPWVKNGDPVLQCHIPSTGILSPEAVTHSLSLARAFYPSAYSAVICHSWMLYPPHYSLFPQNSNLQRFYDRFQIVSAEPLALPTDAWRIFHTFERDLNKVPQETSLQRNLRRFLSEGNSMGMGWGILRL